MMTRKHTSRLSILSAIFICFCLLVVLIPFVWIVLASFKSDSALNSPTKIFFSPDFGRWADLLNGPVPGGFVTSAGVGLSTVAVALCVGTPAAFAISNYRAGGAQTRFGILISQVVPPAVLVVPIFLAAYYVSINGSVIPIIAAHLTLVIPIVTWFLIGFFDGVPKDYEEQALVDGCTRFQAFRKVMIPQVGSGIGAAAIFGFILSWNDMFYALILGGDVRTLPVVISGYNTFFRGVQIGNMAVAVIVSAVPTVIFSFFVQKRLIQGIGGGGLKG